MSQGEKTHAEKLPKPALLMSLSLKSKPRMRLWTMRLTQTIACVGVALHFCGVALAAPQPTPNLYQYSYTAPECAPWDGPAWMVILQTIPVTEKSQNHPKASYPNIMVHVWSGRLPMKRWLDLASPTNKAGSITFCKSQGQCNIYPGWVKFYRQEPGYMEGDVKFQNSSPPGAPPEIHFKAPILQTTALCG